MTDEILKGEKRVIVKNIAPFDVERAGQVFKAGKERFVYFSQKLNPEISACSHLVVITNRHILEKEVADKTIEKIAVSNGYLKHPEVSIVIPVKDALKYVKKCLKSLKTYTDNYELIIVDNNSNEKTKKYLNNIDWLNFKLITNKENKGISYGWNQGIKSAKYDYVCLQNSDTLFSPNWLGKLMKGFNFLENVGVVGPTTSRTGSNQTSPITRGMFRIEDQNIINKFAESLNESYKQTAVVGFCWVIKKEVFEKIGVFDYKRYGLAFYEDLDFLWRAMKSGFKSVWSCGSYVHHCGAKTTTEMEMDVKKAKNINRKIYNKRQNDPNLYVKNDVKLKGKVKKIDINVKKSKKIVITANIGKYDNITEEHFFNPDYEFVLFTEDKNLKSSLWKVIYIKPDFEDPRRESRRYKWLPHKFFPKAKYSLWVDSNIIIRIDINTLIERYLKDDDIAMHKHSRNCIYKEAEVCISRKLDYVDIIKEQMKRYRLEGYPENNGLYENTIILRRHTPKIKKMNEMVWKEICASSTRDQLCFAYVAWKLGIKINPFPGSCLDPKNSYFRRVGHKINKRKYVKDI